ACFAEIVENFSYYEYIEESDCFLLYDKSEKMVCKALFSMPYCVSVKGYNGNVPLVIVVSPDDKVQKIHLLANSETPSFVNRIVAQGFLDTWSGLSLKEASIKNVDAITGATFSSTAIKESVRIRLEKFVGGNSENRSTFADTNNLIGLAVSFAFLIFAGLCFWEPKRFAKYRVVLLVASIGILGFWQGQFVSIAKLSAWLTSGVNWQLEFFLFLVFIAGIIAPFVLGKSFYCMFVCPFGACQELVGKVNPKHKIKIPVGVAKYLRMLRYVLLVVLGSFLCVGLDISIENFEPFSAFKFQFASLTVLILAGVMLVLSIFVNRPWCTYFCPTGALFSLFMSKDKKKVAENEEK
ncbi:MAG: 4Fe-4S binding protein, partial [Bacteroidales bacterium]|nr:4Fe-4S binding protein [Bacteroidales bacterium]